MGNLPAPEELCMLAEYGFNGRIGAKAQWLGVRSLPWISFS
jgi:hypothetical protein